MGHFLSGSAGKLQWTAKELAPGSDACLLAGCTAEAVGKESYVGSGALDKPQCIQEVELSLPTALVIHSLQHRASRLGSCMRWVVLG